MKRHNTNKQTRNGKMETHPTQKESMLQEIYEHHPRNSKDVKYSVQLKEKNESNIKCIVSHKNFQV